jgi:hypothetical protein
LITETATPKREAPPKRAERERVDYTSEDIFRNCSVDHGRIFLMPAQGYAQMSGIGMVLPLNPSSDMKGTYHNVRYGRVLACGKYALRNGEPSNVPGYPLAPGTYVEHTEVIPLKTIEGFEVVACVSVVRHWPNGDPPPWWPKEES